MRFELLFVRHGESCANAWQHISKLTQATYQDPELTTKGRQISVVLYRRLKKWLQERAAAAGLSSAKELNYTIGASDLMRAQMTAFYMLAFHEQMPINIMPFVGERGYSPDNLAFSREDQRQLYESTLPDILPLLNAGKDARDKQGYINKSNFPSFMDWAEKNPDFFGLGPDGVYRSIIFTHSQFLQSAFKTKNVEGDPLTKITNNDIVYTVIDATAKGSDGAYNVFYPKWKYVAMFKPDIGDECPKNYSCRIPRPCKQAAGNKRKTQRRLRSRSRSQ